MIILIVHHLMVLVEVESFVVEFLFVDDRLSMDDSVPSAVSALTSGDRERSTLRPSAQAIGHTTVLENPFQSHVCFMSLGPH